MHWIKNVKNDVMPHKTFTFSKQHYGNLESRIYVLLDKEKSPQLKNGVKLHTFLTLALQWRAWEQAIAVWIRENCACCADRRLGMSHTWCAFAESRPAVVQTLTIQFTDWYIPHNFYWIYADIMFYLIKV